MAGSPRYTVYNADGVYMASCKEPEAAGALVAFYGKGATIRVRHSARWTLWREGFERIPASENYDYVAAVCVARDKSVLCPAPPRRRRAQLDAMKK